MKNSLNLVMLIMVFFLLSCDKDDPVPAVNENSIANISMLQSSSVGEAQEIEVTIQKATPCHVVSEVQKSVSENNFNYNIILQGQENPCTTVISKEVVTVAFDPSNAGQYTLKFSINGELFETRTVSVTE